MSLVNLTLSQITAALLYSDPDYPNGAAWPAGVQITYSIATATSVWNTYGAGSEPYLAGYGLLSLAQAAQFRAAMAVWDSYIAPNFSEVADNASGSGLIRVAFTDLPSGVAGTTYTPVNTAGRVLAKGGDIWLSHQMASGSLTGYNLEVALHEIGHALGVTHPFSDDSTPVNYLPDAYQNRHYTIMSYTDTALSQAVWVSYSGATPTASVAQVYPSTPMVLDIAAVQAAYGADPTTHAENTLWSFSGRGDLSVNGASEATWPYMRTIYDAGGTDTLDLTQMNRHSVIDLRPGSYSSIGLFTLDEQIAYYRALYPRYVWSASQFSSSEYTGTDNLGISFSTVIENVNLGAYSDTLFGNDAGNLIKTGQGYDTIDGGGGVDTVVYSGTVAGYSVTLSPDGATITIADRSPRDGTDTLTHVEHARFTDFTLVFDLHSAQDLLVYKLYQASFARTPDTGGFRYWAGQADVMNLSALSLADAFLAAPEFAQKYGAAPSDQAYVTALYLNVLGRAPDQGGLDYWVGNLGHGEARDQLLVDFAQSPENANLVAAHTTAGYWTL